MKYLICFLISDVVFFSCFSHLSLSAVAISAEKEPEMRFLVCAPTSEKKSKICFS